MSVNLCELYEIIPGRPTGITHTKWNLENDKQLRQLTRIVNRMPKSTQKHPWATFQGRFFCGRPNGAIMVCDLQTGETKGVLKRHESPIKKLYTSNGKLFSESTDGIVNIWNAKGKLIFTKNRNM